MSDILLTTLELAKRYPSFEGLTVGDYFIEAPAPNDEGFDVPSSARVLRKLGPAIAETANGRDPVVFESHEKVIRLTGLPD